MIDKFQSEKNILYMITKSNWGGAQRYVYDLATNPPEGFRSEILTSGNGILIKKVLDKKIEVHRIGSMQRDISIFKEFLSFFKIFKILLKTKPEIVHLNSSKAAGIGALACRLTGVPKIIFTAHGWAFNENRPFWQIILIKFFSWLTIILSDVVIVLSKKEFDQVKNWPGAKNKTHIVPIGIKEDDEINNLINIKTIPILNYPKIVSIGELHKNKGYIDALNALSKINKPFQYIIIGSGEDQEKIEKFIKNNKLENKVFLAGFIENASRYLGGADLFLLTSHKEGLPYVLLEAGMKEIPIIATDVGGIPELCQENRAVCIPPKNPGAIKREVEIFLDSPIKGKERARLMKNYLESKHSLNNMISLTHKIYTSQ